MSSIPSTTFPVTGAEVTDGFPITETLNSPSPTSTLTSASAAPTCQVVRGCIERDTIIFSFTRDISPQQCRQICDDQPDCLAYSISRTSGFCAILDRAAIESVNEGATSNKPSFCSNYAILDRGCDPTDAALDLGINPTAPVPMQTESITPCAVTGECETTAFTAGGTPQVRDAVVLATGATSPATVVASTTTTATSTAAPSSRTTATSTTSSAAAAQSSTPALCIQIQGCYQDFDTIATFNNVTPDQCRQICDDNVNCQSYAISRTPGFCAILNQPSVGAVDGERSATDPAVCSGFFILDAGCDLTSAARALGLTPGGGTEEVQSVGGNGNGNGTTIARKRWWNEKGKKVRGMEGMQDQGGEERKRRTRGIEEENGREKWVVCLRERDELGL